MKLFSKQKRFGTALLLCWVVSTVEAHAAVSISELIASQGSVVSGDKRFDQFSFSSTGDMPPADQVLVVSREDFSGNYGIRLFGAFLDHPGDGPSELTVGYRVAVLDPDRRIAGATLAGNPTAIRTGAAVITETFGDHGQLQIYDENPGSSKFIDSMTFDEALPELDVEVLLVAESLVTGENGGITISFVDQNFSQSVIPEPGSIVVWMGMALLIGVGSVSIRYRKAVERRH